MRLPLSIQRHHRGGAVPPGPSRTFLNSTDTGNCIPAATRVIYRQQHEVLEAVHNPWPRLAPTAPHVPMRNSASPLPPPPSTTTRACNRRLTVPPGSDATTHIRSGPPTSEPGRCSSIWHGCPCSGQPCVHETDGYQTYESRSHFGQALTQNSGVGVPMCLSPGPQRTRRSLPLLDRFSQRRHLDRDGARSLQGQKRPRRESI